MSTYSRKQLVESVPRHKVLTPLQCWFFSINFFYWRWPPVYCRNYIYAAKLVNEKYLLTEVVFLPPILSKYHRLYRTTAENRKSFATRLRINWANHTIIIVQRTLRRISSQMQITSSLQLRRHYSKTWTENHDHRQDQDQGQVSEQFLNGTSAHFSAVPRARPHVWCPHRSFETTAMDRHRLLAGLK